MKILHKLTNTEISRGIICPRKNGTAEFFSKLEDSFDVIIRGTKLYERTVGNKQIWIGRMVMRQFNPNDIIAFSKKGKLVIIE